MKSSVVPISTKDFNTTVYTLESMIEISFKPLLCNMASVHSWPSRDKILSKADGVSETERVHSVGETDCAQQIT